VGRNPLTQHAQGDAPGQTFFVAPRVTLRIERTDMGSNSLIEENKRLRARIAQLEKQVSDYGWANEGKRNYEQEERSKWGIFG
jgi:hypothetical protein